MISAFAPAKVNLTLRVLGRRADGYHELESLVAFADIGDDLTLAAGEPFGLEVLGPGAGAAGPTGDNLVLKAARALADRVEGLTLGRFVLTKYLPVAAGLGGGSADAAAALRLLAQANGILLDDPRLMAAARATGADVPVCLDPGARVMRGIGDVLSDPLDLPRLDAVLVNPGVALATRDVFARLDAPALGGPADAASEAIMTADADALNDAVYRGTNDLEPPAITLQPVIAEVLAALRRIAGCRLVRMSGSGATCFGVFDSPKAAASAADGLASAKPDWWVRETTLG